MDSRGWLKVLNMTHSSQPLHILNISVLERVMKITLFNLVDL